MKVNNPLSSAYEIYKKEGISLPIFSSIMLFQHENKTKKEKDGNK